MELREGTGLNSGNYRVIKSLGRGGFAITYLAEQVHTGRKVCIKEFFPENYYRRNSNTSALLLNNESASGLMQRFINKFIKEAQTISRLNHPNIIHIFDTFLDNNTAYYVMEYVDGMSVEQYVNEHGAMNEVAAVNLIGQVSAALHYIHQQQMLHLDVKPGNIMIRRSDNQAVLIDFGLAKNYDETGSQTSATPICVSHGFTPFEQYQRGGVSSFTPQTDIYSLGATFYFMLVGKEPPAALELIDRELPAMSSNISEGSRRAVAAAMCLRRENRPYSVKEFLTILQSGMVEDNPPRTPRPPQHVSSPSGSDDSANGGKRTLKIWLLAILSIVGIALILAVPLSRVIRDSYYQDTTTNKTHGEVDLGLSVNWATCNVGADYPWSSGDCYAWGEIYTKNNYSDKTYSGPNINNISGTSNYDVAREQWGGNWRMPTREEINELVQLCKWELGYNNGVYGYYITGPSGRSIFLPFAGGYAGNVRAKEGEFGGYWSGNYKGNGMAYGLGMFPKRIPGINSVDWAYMGRSIRPVRDKR